MGKYGDYLASSLVIGHIAPIMGRSGQLPSRPKPIYPLDSQYDSSIWDVTEGEIILTNHSKSVLTFGEPLVVCIPNGQGSLSTMRQFQTDHAGAELNTAIGLARLGIPSTFAASVGTDPFGDLIIRDLRAEGVYVQYIHQSPTCPTGLFFKQWTPLRANPEVFYYRSVSPMGQGDWNADVLRSALKQGAFSFVHTTGITWMLHSKTRKIAEELLHLACEAQIPVSFDVNIRLKLASIESWRETIREILPYVTWLFLGDSEAVALYGTGELEALGEILRADGFTGRGVVLKCGAKGAIARVNGQVTQVRAWPVSSVVDTVGAGDGFNAGFIAGLLKNWEVSQAMQLGSIVGAYAVASPGDSSGYPTWRDVEDQLEGKEGVTR